MQAFCFEGDRVRRYVSLTQGHAPVVLDVESVLSIEVMNLESHNQPFSVRHFNLCRLKYGEFEEDLELVYIGAVDLLGFIK